jgi:hypothetical protein
MRKHRHQFPSDRIGAACETCGMTRAEVIRDEMEEMEDKLSKVKFPSKSMERRVRLQHGLDPLGPPPAPTVTLTVEALERVVREAWYSGAGTTLRACGAEWTDAELDREGTAYVARVLREIGGGR